MQVNRFRLLPNPCLTRHYFLTPCHVSESRALASLDHLCSPVVFWSRPSARRLHYMASALLSIDSSAIVPWTASRTMLGTATASSRHPQSPQAKSQNMQLLWLQRFFAFCPANALQMSCKCPAEITGDQEWGLERCLTFTNGTRPKPRGLMRLQFLQEDKAATPCRVPRSRAEQVGICCSLDGNASLSKPLEPTSPPPAMDGQTRPPEWKLRWRSALLVSFRQQATTLDALFWS